MFVKIITSTGEPYSAITLVYEVDKFDFRYLNPEEQTLNNGQKAIECISLYRNMEVVENRLLFSGDEIWVTGETGKTVDRWII